MKRLSLGIAVAAAVGLGPGSLSAADLPVKAPPPVAPALYNWSGLYIGPEGGAIMGQNSDFLEQPVPFNGFCAIASLCVNAGHPMHGGFVGGEGGFNWQVDRWVFGIEGDGQWAELEESLTCPGDPRLSCGSRIDNFESVRGRIGYAFGPRGDFLVFLTGGWATANQSLRVGFLILPGGPPFEEFHRVNGFQVGGGAEYGITPWLSLKGEVLYTWFQSHTFCPGPPCFNVNQTLGIQEPIKIHDDFVLARMGLNWRLWWGKGKGPAPVVASY